MPVAHDVRNYVDGELRRLRDELAALLGPQSGAAWSLSDADAASGGAAGTVEDGGASAGLSGGEDGGFDSFGGSEDGGSDDLGAGGTDGGYNPIYMQIAANGAVTFVFQGSLALPEAAAGTLVPSSSVQWQDTNQVVREFIQGYNLSGARSLISACEPDANDIAAVTLNAQATGPAASGQVLLSAEDSVTAVLKQLVALDSTNRTGYVFNNRTQPQACFFDYGSASVSIPANTVAATTAVSFHNSAFGGFTGGVGPFVLAITQGSQNIVCNTSGVTGSGFTLRAFWADGAATHAAASPTCVWFAIGT